MGSNYHHPASPTIIWISVSSIDSDLSAKYVLSIAGSQSDGVVKLTNAEIDLFDKLTDKIENRLYSTLKKGIHKAQTRG